MNGLKELKRLALENACCRCQYYNNGKCENKDKCVWLEIADELKTLRVLKKHFKIEAFKVGYNFNKHYAINISDKETDDERYNLMEYIEEKEYEIVKGVLR